MSWIVGSYSFHYTAKTERDQHTQGDGSEYNPGGWYDHKKLFMAGTNFRFYCIPRCVVFHE